MDPGKVIFFSRGIFTLQLIFYAYMMLREEFAAQLGPEMEKKLTALKNKTYLVHNCPVQAISKEFIFSSRNTFNKRLNNPFLIFCFISLILWYILVVQFHQFPLGYRASCFIVIPATKHRFKFFTTCLVGSGGLERSEKNVTLFSCILSKTEQKKWKVASHRCAHIKALRSK